MSFPDAHRPGYAVYSRTSLAVYDFLVLGFSNRFLWRCASRHMVAHYERHLSASHLDVGVGTGYFLDRARPQLADLAITLLDPNRSCLDVAAARIERLKPRLVQADALVPWPQNLGRFGSIGLNYLLHCLPVPMAAKARLFDNLLPHLADGGTVFGATILQGDVPRNAAARRLMRIYNAKGVFSNEDDTPETLRTELSHRFADVDIRVIGCVALFSARTPRG